MCPLISSIGLMMQKFDHAFDVVLVCTNYFSLRAFTMPLERQLRLDYRVCIVSNLTEHEYKLISSEFGAEHYIFNVKIERKPSLIRDLLALIKLTKFFIKVNPKLVFTMMPKAGLLGMLGALCAGVPIRVHCFTGQTWYTKKSMKRWLLKAADKIIARTATNVLVDGKGQLTFITAEGIVPIDKADVIWNGSIAGIEFRDLEISENYRTNLRQKFGFSRDDVVILFMSRMTADKGFNDVLKLFAKLRKLDGKYKLLLVGPDEEGLVSRVDTNVDADVQYIEYSDNAPEILQICEVFLSPSRREGLPMTLLQALSLNVHVFVSDIYGNNDLVRHGENGYLHPVGDIDVLTEQIQAFVNGMTSLSDTDFSKKIKNDFDREQFGVHLRRYVSTLFSSSR